MAVALSLLIVLPGLAQSQSYDDTRGSLSGGANLTVSVLETVGTANNARDAVENEVLAGSYFNGDLYVSNDDEAHNMVRITATGSNSTTPFAGRDGELRDVADAAFDRQANNNVTFLAAHDESDDNIDCVVATVRNNRSGKTIKVSLNTTDQNRDANSLGLNESVVFEVIGNGIEEENNGTRVCGEEKGEQVTPTVLDASGSDIDGTAEDAVHGQIPARHGDTLTITVSGLTGSVTLKVDADGPDFSEISPEHGAYISSQTVKFRFVVADTDSGLAHDGELDYTRGDRDARAFNTDDDNYTTGEPRSMSDGKSHDIRVVFGTDADGVGGKDEGAAGTSGWRQRGGRPGVSYFQDMAVTNRDEATHYWYLEATDRAGNTAKTEANDDGDPFRLVVDVSNPEFRDARTGISFDTSKRREVVDRSSIAVTFEDKDSLDALKDVDIDKFLVDGNTVTGFIQPGAKSDCDEDTPSKERYPKDIDELCFGAEVPQSRIYLQLTEELAPDARPQVSMFGGAALDLAGNPSNQDEVIPADFIAPNIMVTLVTDVTGRPVVTRGGEITLSITSDEELRRLPAVWFAKIVDGGESGSEDQSVVLNNPRSGDRVSAVSGEDNSWEQTYDNNDVGNSDGLYAVIVVGEDDNDNVGSTVGWDRDRTTKTPTGEDADLDDLEGANLLVEVDRNSNTADPDFSLTPETGTGTNDTESTNPFITIDFGDEKDEYGDYVYEAGHAKAGEKISNFGDSHSAVAITSITLNGNDVSDGLSSVTNRKYTLGARDLAVGSYELKVTGTDDVGNELSDSYKFSVVPREAYEIDLTPGWNLVSVPGTPLDSSIGAVLGDSMQASIVLAYQNDAWLTAVNDNGTWRGTLTDIVGGYGYWVQTTAFESISTLIPETDTSSVLPTARVIEGWNLLGVVDVLQNPAGEAPSGGSEADDYFGNISWRVAYAFDTSNNQWLRSLPDVGADDEIENGKGYWVWSTAAGVLVP